jgi:hypothetical protein
MTFDVSSEFPQKLVTGFMHYYSEFGDHFRKKSRENSLVDGLAAGKYSTPS